MEETVREAKLFIMENAMASELNVLAREAGRVARSHPKTADFTNNVLVRALKRIVACFPVYRTYVDGSEPTDADRRDISWAIAQARRIDSELDPSVFDFLNALLTCDLVAQPKSGFSRVAVTRAAMRFQQYSGPVMAKGLEDTAFYRFNRLLALNEVGGSPERFGMSVPQFHAANAQRAQATPHALLSTSTHDTKRGEDLRARLAVLSEMPQEWAEQVTLWSRMLRARDAGLTEELPPDRADEYTLYQLLVGAWPEELMADDADASVLKTFRARIEGAMLKSMREAKLRTSWDTPDEAYEAAVVDFIRNALDDASTNPFLGSIRAFLTRLAPLGVANSLVQTVLKLTVPGVPDIYQGAELWDLSLVDPDNRRPIDFAARRALLERDASETPHPDLRHMLANWQDGAIKLHLTAALLRLRRKYPALFAEGSYEPLTAEGPDAERVCAFLRRTEDTAMLVATLLFPARGTPTSAAEPTTVALPDDMPATGWRELFTGRAVEAPALDRLFEAIPAAIFVRGG